MHNVRAQLALLAPLLVACAHAGVRAPAAASTQAKPEPPAAPPPADLDESLSRLKAKLGKMAADEKLPNGAIGIVRGDRLIWFQGFGNRDDKGGVPVDENTTFRIGSITKTLTGVALLRLRDAGKLSLEDPLSKYIPEAAQVVVPGGARVPIRLRHLVTHSSGLPREINSWSVSQPGPSEAEMIAALKGLQLDFEPGTDEQYSNYAMALSGVVIARASGEDYRTYMQRQVFAPLEMSRTVFDPAELPTGSLAMGFERQDGKTPYAPIANQVDLGGLEPCGGLYSTVSDLAHFAAFEMAAWSGGDARILSRASRLESQAPAALPLLSGGFVGVDWQLADASIGRRVWHNGGIDGYRAVLALYPKRGLGIIALTGSSDQESTLWNMEAAAVQALAPFVPAPRAHAGPPIQAALARLLDFVSAPSPDKLGRVFSQGFRDDLRDPHILDTAKDFQRDIGPCRKPGVLASGGNSAASVWYTCEKRSVRMDVSLEPVTGLIGYWWFHWDS